MAPATEVFVIGLVVGVFIYLLVRELTRPDCRNCEHYRRDVKGHRDKDG